MDEAPRVTAEFPLAHESPWLGANHLELQGSITRTLADNATLGLLMMDARQHCVYMNVAAEAITGFALAEVQGRPLHDFVHHSRPDGRPYPIAECPIERALPSARRQQGEEMFVRKDGQLYPVAFTASPILDAGVPIGTILEIKDVTEEKRAQAARARGEAEQRLLAEASELLLGSFNFRTSLGMLAERVVPAVADWCAIDLVENDGAGGTLVQEIALVHTDPSKLEWVRELRRRIRRRPDSGIGKVLRTGAPELIANVTDDDLVGYAADASMLEKLRGVGMRSVLLTPLRARRQVIGVVTLVGVAPRRAFEASDLAFAIELAHRAALFVENARLYQQAQEAVRLRDEFLSIASHELRTPLTPLQLQLQHVERMLDEPDVRELLPARVSVACQRARKQVDRLISLVENLLDVSRVESGHLMLYLERVDLAELVQDVVARFSEDAARSGSQIEVVADAGAVGAWDRLRLEQVVVNLLSNALKYGSARPIAIRIQRNGASACVRVTDRGIGIAPDQLQRIFGRFERAVSARAYGGLGLGLYIVQQIVRAHGGTVCAESSEGAGATFTVELPLASMPSGPADARPRFQP